MKIIWDEPKRLANLDKHGMDFADLNERFLTPLLSFRPDTIVIAQSVRIFAASFL